MKKTVFFFLSILILFNSCKKDDGINVPLNSEVNEFIWQGLRTYYLWKEEVPDLEDDRFDTFDELHTFLNQYNSPDDLFEHFLWPNDRFSWIVDNYQELDDALQGKTDSHGYKYNLVRFGNSERIFGYVEYVIPNTSASSNGLQRGDVFYAVNGIELTDTNFRDLLNQVSVTLSLGNYNTESKEVVPSGERITMTLTEVDENPVFLTKTFDVQGNKVGYLVYNQFINTYHSELNAAFSEFLSEGVTEMILDLRYNPGGSVTTSRVLASMLYGEADASTVFGRIEYNEALSSFDSDINFLEEVPLLNAEGDIIGEEAMNRLNISRVFILTTGGTASASEMIIAGLRPYIDVTVVGDTTVGKNVGSITLYDSPDSGYLTKNGINESHTYGMQPIVSRISNSVGFGEYVDGLVPNVLIEEFELVENLVELGDENEPLLATALELISGSGRIASSKESGLKQVYSPRLNQPYSQIIIDGGLEKNVIPLLDPLRID